MATKKHIIVRAPAEQDRPRFVKLTVTNPEALKITNPESLPGSVPAFDPVPVLPELRAAARQELETWLRRYAYLRGRGDVYDAVAMALEMDGPKPAEEDPVKPQFAQGPQVIRLLRQLLSKEPQAVYVPKPN
jgi:hypothetical protein